MLTDSAIKHYKALKKLRITLELLLREHLAVACNEYLLNMGRYVMGLADHGSPVSVVTVDDGRTLPISEMIYTIWYVSSSFWLMIYF